MALILICVRDQRIFCDYNKQQSRLFLQCFHLFMLLQVSDGKQVIGHRQSGYWFRTNRIPVVDKQFTNSGSQKTTNGEEKSTCVRLCVAWIAFVQKNGVLKPFLLNQTRIAEHLTSRWWSRLWRSQETIGANVRNIQTCFPIHLPVQWDLASLRRVHALTIWSVKREGL